jgi:type I restriction enzyme S subunit
MTTATKYKTYPQYKPSGIDWLGDIPAEWEAKRLRYFFDYHAGGVWGDEEKGDQNDLICLRVADFDFDYFGLSDTDLTTRNIPENQHSRILEKGDILLEKSGGGEKQTVGRAVRFDSNDRAVCSNFIEKLTPLKVHNSKYISYLMGALYFGTINVRSIKQTTGIQNLDIYTYFSEVVPFPEKTIQKSIADFLDRETEKIDEMLAKKQKMIDLLKEKRQALITHTVTKGLDPKAKMKPSGIDWLGDIPAEWDVWKYGHLFLTSMGETILREDLVDDGKIPVYSATEENINFGYVDSASVILDKGDLVIPARGNSIGNVKLVDKLSTTTQTTIYSKLIKKNKTDIRYVLYLLKGLKDVYFFFDRTAIPQITVNQVQNNDLCIPPIEDQKSIAEFLDRETAKIDGMMKKVEMQIEKLQEYRQALITNAVTGKIKV